MVAGLFLYGTLGQTLDMHHLLSSATPQVHMGKLSHGAVHGWNACECRKPPAGERQGLCSSVGLHLDMMQAPRTPPPCRSHRSSPKATCVIPGFPRGAEGLGSSEEWVAVEEGV